MGKMRVYISGNGDVPTEKTEQMFFEAEQRLKENPNYEVFNSYELGFTGKLENEDAKDWFELIWSCDAIYLLDGWLDSAHSISERELMRKMGKAIMYEKELPIYAKFDKTKKIRDLIHSELGYSFESYRAKGRNDERFFPRVLFTHYCFEWLGLKKCEIAPILNQNNCNVIHSLKKYDDLKNACPDFKEMNQIFEDTFLKHS